MLRQQIIDLIDYYSSSKATVRFHFYNTDITYLYW